MAMVKRARKESRAASTAALGRVVCLALGKMQAGAHDPAYLVEVKDIDIELRVVFKSGELRHTVD
jgi:hypothetical protein